MDVTFEAVPGAVALGPRSSPSPPSSSNGSAGAEETVESRNAALGVARATKSEGFGAGIRQAGPLALAGLAANGANVVVTLLLARLLTTRGYGALAQLTSLFLVVSMPGTAVIVGVVRRVTALAAEGRGASVRRWAHRAHLRANGAVAVALIVALAVCDPLAHALSIPAPVGVFAALAAGVVWVLLSFDRGLLQAGQAYRTLSVNLLVEGGMRTAGVLCLVGVGFGVVGAAWGMLIAELVTAVHARVAAKKQWGFRAAHQAPRSWTAASDGAFSADSATPDDLAPGSAVTHVAASDAAGSDVTLFDGAAMFDGAALFDDAVLDSTMPDSATPDDLAPGSAVTHVAASDVAASDAAGADVTLFDGAAFDHASRDGAPSDPARRNGAVSHPKADRRRHRPPVVGRDEGRWLVWDVGAALVAMALLAYLQNVDVIVLSREAPHASGPYAAISVASKALVFGAIALGGYLLPEAAIEWHRGRHALRQLGVTALVLAVPGVALLLAAVVFPQKVLSLVFSSRYVGAHEAFGLLAVAMVFLSATVVMTLYLLAAGQRWVGGLLIAGALVATVVLAGRNGVPGPTAAADLAVQAGLAVVTAGAFAWVHLRRPRRRLLEGSPA